MDTNPIVFDKRNALKGKFIAMSPDADFQVALSALSSTSNTSGYTAVPLDIVLVLDVSGSMAEKFGTGGQTKLASLKAAVNNFLDKAAEVNKGISDDDKRINISLVKFAGNKNDAIGDDTYDVTTGSWLFPTTDTYNCSQIVKPLTTCNTDNVGTLKDAVNKLTARGATRADYGLEYAQKALNGSGKRSDANKIVIFFTDGSPTSSSDYEGGVAHDAIQKAQQLKTSKVQIYTIGIFDDANSAAPDKNSSAENTFMHAVSSNYPKAECVDTQEYKPGIFGGEYYTKHTVTPYDRAPNSAFYKTASNAGALTEVFTDIFTEVSSGLMGPTHVEDGDPSAGGYVTFYDRLGDFMEVKGIDGVAFADTIYEASKWGKWNKNSPVAGTDTFEFKNEEISNGVSEAYPQHANLNNIKISVVRGTGAEGDYVTVQIPASMLPLRKYTVATNIQGETKLTVSDTFPINILYSVGLRQDVRTALENGTSTDPNLVKYVTDNADKTTGKISFYSNKYSGKTLNNVTVGDTTATFVPASSNSFYYHTVNAPLYKDEAFANPVTNFETDTQYYYKLTYYEVKDGTTKQVTKAVPMTITDENAVEDCIGYKNGQAYIKKGTLKGSMPAALDSQLGAKKDPVTKQDVNPTGTAARRIDFQWDLSSSTAHLYLGNNGRITYNAKGSLKIKKVVNAAAGLTPDKNDTFKIKVDLTGADGSYKYTINDEDSGKTIKSGETLELKANDVAEIVGLPAGCTYTVTEPEDMLPDGYTKDGISIENRTGTITAGLVNTTAPTVTVTNTYTPKAFEAEFTGSKKLSGRGWEDSDTFNFTLTASDNAPMPAEGTTGNTKTVTVSNKNEAADFTFGKIAFKQPGTYRYTIREDRGSIPGVSYDGSTYTVTVVVRADKGKLDGTVTYEKNSSAPTNAPAPNKAAFTNTYKAEDEEVYPVAFKKYVDDSGSTSLQDKQFQFTLVPANVNENNDPLAEDLVNSTPKPSIPTATNDVNGRITFGTIKFDSTNNGHKYYYLMSEVPDSDSNSNITYSQDTYLVEYTVNNNAAIGELEATPTYYKKGSDGNWQKVDDENSVIFTNTYNAKSVDVTLRVHKQLDGRTWQTDDDFTFTLTATGDTPVLDSNTYTRSVTQTSQSADFPAITYKKIGTYTYTITENDFDHSKIPGVTAGNPVTVTVTVTNDNGQLKADVNYSDSYTDTESGITYAKYINTYSTIAVDQKASDLFRINKNLDGREWTPNDSFEFLLEGDSDSPMPEQGYRNAYATNTNNSPSIGGDSTLQFTAAGKYNYYISEVQGNQDNGLTYDTTRYKVVVTVDGESTENNTVKLKVGSVQYFKGTLNADGTTYTYSDTAEKEAVATFINHYDASIPAGTTFPLTGYKSLLNRPAHNGEFLFTLTDITNGPDKPGTILQASNQDGMFTFNVNLNPVQTTYTELLAQAAQPADGSEQPASAPAEIQNLLERRYILAETVPADTKGVTYDTTTYLVVVPLKDDGNGKLYVDNDNIKYYRNSDEDTGETPNLSFANSYTAESVTLPITARKELTGRALQAGEFTFQLKDAQGTVLQTARNEADGSIHFTLRYDDKQDDTALESDSYTYTISEVAGSEDTIAYDAATYTFTVNVTDKGDGKLVAELDQPQDMVFRNSYTPKPTPTPTPTPSAAPTPAPTTAPAAAPQATPAPTDAPTATPTASPAPTATAPTATAPAATATPASVIPRTADSFPLALLIGLAIVSCGALGILYTAKKRRK